MFISSWFPWRLARQHKGRTRPSHAAAWRLRGTRLACEQLEDRTVPSGGLTILKVTSLNDSGKDTLREAILQADKGNSSKTYEIDIVVTGTILLKSSLPHLAKPISIV